MRKVSSTNNTLFDKFWAAYPKHVGKDKALKAFIKLSLTEELFVCVMKELEKQKTYYNWGKQNWKYIPHPATWLNQKRWEDETEGGNTGIPEDRNTCGAYIF